MFFCAFEDVVRMDHPVPEAGFIIRLDQNVDERYLWRVDRSSYAFHF